MLTGRQLLFEPEAPRPVQVVVRVGAKSHHRLGAGDAGDLGELLGDDLGQALEVRDAHHDHEVVGAGDGVGLGNALHVEHRLGRLLHPLVLGSDEHYGRYHAFPPLQTERDRAVQGVVVQSLLVLYGPGLDGRLDPLVQGAGDKAADLDGRRPLRLYAGHRRVLGLALGVRVQHHLDVDSGLGYLAAVRDGDGEDCLLVAREHDVSAGGQRPTGDGNAVYLDAVHGARVAPGRAGRGGGVEADLAVVHERLGLLEVAAVARLACLLEGLPHGGDVVVGDNRVARPEVLDGGPEGVAEAVAAPADGRG